MLTAVILNAQKPARLLRGQDVRWGVPRHSGEASRLEAGLRELKAEREAAQEALRRMGWR